MWMMLRAYIPASNVSRARKFYEGILGLRPNRNMPAV